MKRNSPPIQARNTILARDIANKLSALSKGSVTVPTCLELVAAARGFASYAAYTRAVKDKTEPADIKMAQFWLINSKVLEPRIAALGLAKSLDTAGLIVPLQSTVNELMTKFPDCSVVIAHSPGTLFEDALETFISEAITDALNPLPKTREDLANQNLDMRLAFGALSVSKVGPLPEKVGGWLRASVCGKTERDDPRGIYADPEDKEALDFIARVRLRRFGKQLYSSCQAEILVLGDTLTDGIKPDSGSDPAELTALIGTVEPEPSAQQTGIKLLRDLEQSGQVPTRSEIETIIDSFSNCTPKQLAFIETYAAPLAVRLVNMKKGAVPRKGVRILEALVASRCQNSKLSLAHALHNGWGCDKDPYRVRTLVTELLDQVDGDQLDFLEPVSYAVLYSLAAALWMQGTGGPCDRAKAYALYRRAADVGHGPSALIVSSFLMPLPAGHEIDEFAGVVESDLKLAETYYLQAERAGYNPKTKTFDLPEVKGRSSIYK